MSSPGDNEPSEDGRKAPAFGDLAARIARAQAQRKAAAGGPAAAGGAGDNTALGRGIRLGTEFIAAVLVGAAMGYLLDLWLGTSPWILLVLLLIGFAAGVLNVVRAAQEMNSANPPPPGSASRLDDEDD